MASVAYAEMGFGLGTHHLRGPARLMGELHLNELYPGHAASGIAGSLLEIVCGRAPWRRGGHDDVSRSARLERDVVNEAKADNVVAKLRVNYELQRLADAVDGPVVIASGMWCEWCL